MSNIVGRTLESVGRSFNLPEMGLSERANSLTPVKNTWGQSNFQDYVVPLNAPQRDPSVNTVPSGMVLGANKTTMTPYSASLSKKRVSNQNPPSAPTNNNPPRSSGGGGNNNIGGQENVDWYTNEFGQRVAIDKGGPSQEDLMREVDGVYGESYGYLDNVEGQLRQDFPNVLQEAESQFRTNSSMLGNQRQSGLNQLQGQEETTQNRQMDALAEARRLYDSLMRGYNQRFGGATSAGGAASEIAAVEQQRQQGGINRDARQTMRQIEVARGEVENNYQTGLLQLEQQKQTALNQANRDFQNKLLEVNRMRSELGQNKAQMRLQALQELRAQAFQIEAENRQFAKQLEMMKRESEISLQNYARQLQMSGQGSQGAVNNFMGQQYAPTQDLKVGGGGQFGGNSPAMTGQISRDDEMFGQISPMRRDEQYF